MRALLFAFGIGILGFSPNSLASEPPELRLLAGKFEDAVARVEAPSAELNEAYSKRLDQLKLKAQKEGDLGLVLAIDRELKSFEFQIEEIPDHYSQLKRARVDYEKRRETVLGNLKPARERLKKIYLEQLGSLQAELTRAGRFEEAVQVKSFAGIVNRDGEPEPTELIAHWRLDGNAEDSSPNKYHGRDFGTSYVGGRIGTGAAAFETGRYVVVENRKELNLLEPFTVAAWVNPEPDVNKVGAPILSKGPGSWKLHLGESGTSLGIGLKEGPEGLAAVSKPGAVVGGRWQHVAAIFTGKDLFLYIDGVRVAEDGKHNYEANHESESDLGIGYDPAEAESAFRGAIDDVRIYKRILEPMEIRALAGG